MCKTINWRFYGNRKITALLSIVLIINLLWLVQLSLQGVSSWKRYQVHIHTDVLTTTPPPPNTTVNPVVLKKLDTIKKDLNTSRDDNIYPAKTIGRYLMVDPTMCQDVRRVDVVIIVHTAPDHINKRQRMRDSFAQTSLYHPFQVRIAFLLGKTENKTLERLLWLEHVRYNDTVMGDFIDDYHNLSYKGVMGYRWVSEHCPNSKFVLKIDDDVLVNMFKLLYTFLHHMDKKEKSIFCNLWYKNTMLILRKGKWKVESHMFRHKKTFPYDYCSGFVVLMTSDLMGPMYEAAKTTPFFWIDDVYLFGMLPSIVGGVTFYNYALDKTMTLNYKIAMNCTQKQGHRCPIFATYISDASYWSYWGMIKDLYVSSTWKVDDKVVE